MSLAAICSGNFHHYCVHAMSVAAVCSGNFHQLKNNLGISCNFKLLNLHNGLFYEKMLDDRRHNKRPLTRRVEVRNSRSKIKPPCSINRSLHTTTVGSSEVPQLKPIHMYNLQEKSSEVKIERPATILVFDLETTGFNRNSDKIIEFAVRDLMGGRNSTFQTLINPEKHVRNQHIHGISSDMVLRPDVPRFKELIPILLQFVQSRQLAGKPVLWVAHNGKTFDVPFLISEYLRCSKEIPADWLFLDTLPLARQVVNADGSKRSISLGALREHYGIPFTGRAHRAMEDVTTLSYVLQRITFDLKLAVPELLEKAFRASDISSTSKKTTRVSN